jgi:hypothetical protein
MAYEPYVTVAGQPVMGTWDGTKAVALDGLKVVWGREDIYEDNPPSSFSIRLVDPTGQWATADTLVGAPIIVYRNPGPVVIRGDITGVSLTRQKTVHPGTGKSVSVWIATLTGSCRLADLAQHHPKTTQTATNAATGYNSDSAYPGQGPWRIPAKPAGWFPPNAFSSTRLAAIQAASPGIVSGMSIPYEIAPALGQATADTLVRLFPQEIDQPSALEMITDVYRAYPLGHANYDATTDTVQLGIPATGAGLQLTEQASGQVIITPAAGLTVPANTVIVPDDATAESTAARAIDIVRVEYKTIDPGGTETDTWIVESQTLRKRSGSKTSRELVVRSPFYIFSEFIYESAAYAYTKAGAAYSYALANKTRDLVDDINSLFTIPTLTFDTRRFDYSAALIDVILDTHSRTTPIYFDGSLFDQLLNMPRQVQIIGGTLTWHGRDRGSSTPAGWVLEATTAPAVQPGIQTSFKLNTLGTRAGVTLGDFAPGIKVQDMGKITIGFN